MYTDTVDVLINRFVSLEPVFSDSASLDAFTNAGVMFKKSVAWLPENPTLIADSNPSNNIRVEIYTRVTY